MATQPETEDLICISTQASIFVKISIDGTVTKLPGGTVKFNDRQCHVNCKIDDGNIKYDMTKKSVIFHRYSEPKIIRNIYAICDENLAKFASTDTEAIEKRRDFLLKNHGMINHVATRLVNYLNPTVLRIVSGDCYIVVDYNCYYGGKFSMENFDALIADSQKNKKCDCIQLLNKMSLDNLKMVLEGKIHTNHVEYKHNDDESFEFVVNDPNDSDNQQLFCSQNWFGMPCIFHNDKCNCPI
jgi:hypothetical protein